MTISEKFFDKYLKSRYIKFEIEQGKVVHPDRLLHVRNKKIICEIRQLERRKGEPINTFATSSPYTILRKAIKKKIRQGKEAKESKLPYVVVLFNYGSRQLMSNFVIEGAMYGDVAIVIDVPADPKQRGKVRGNFFAANGILRHARSHHEPGQPFNKRVSAIAILDLINPADEILHREYEKASKGVTVFERQWQILEQVENRLKKLGKYKRNMVIPRLRVFHNLYADVPLGFDIFDGRYDEQYYIDQVTGESRKYEK